MEDIASRMDYWGLLPSENCMAAIEGDTTGTITADKRVKMVTPLGEEWLHEKPRDWRYTSYVLATDTYRTDREYEDLVGEYGYSIFHDTNGFYKHAMYQISVGFLMSQITHSWLESDWGQINITDQGSETIYRMYVKAICASSVFADEATLHNPKDQTRNTDLETAVVGLIEDHTKQYAIDHSEIPGSIETFIINMPSG